MEIISTPNSSNLNKVEYDGKDLYVTFKSGGTYRYDSVPRSIFEGFITAPSAGRYFHMNVKGRYPYRKIKG